MPKMREVVEGKHTGDQGIDLIGFGEDGKVYLVEVKGGPGTGAELGETNFGGVQMSKKWCRENIDRALGNKAIRTQLKQITGLRKMEDLANYLKGGERVLVVPDWKKVSRIKGLREAGLSAENVYKVP